MGVFCISHLHLASSSTHLALIFTKVLKKNEKERKKSKLAVVILKKL